jgi:hypothetical protein
MWTWWTEDFIGELVDLKAREQGFQLDSGGRQGAMQCRHARNSGVVGSKRYRLP